MGRGKPTKPTIGPASMLRAARAAADMTLPEFAAAIGTSTKSLSRWETGVSAGWTRDHLAAAAHAADWPEWAVTEGFETPTGQKDGGE